YPLIIYHQKIDITTPPSGTCAMISDDDYRPSIILRVTPQGSEGCLRRRPYRTCSMASKSGSRRRQAMAQSEQLFSPCWQLSIPSRVSCITGRKSCISMTWWGHATTQAEQAVQISVATISE